MLAVSHELQVLMECWHGQRGRRWFGCYACYQCKPVSQPADAEGLKRVGQTDLQYKEHHSVSGPWCSVKLANYLLMWYTWGTCVEGGFRNGAVVEQVTRGTSSSEFHFSTLWIAPFFHPSFGFVRDPDHVLETPEEKMSAVANCLCSARGSNVNDAVFWVLPSHRFVPNYLDIDILPA